MKVKILDSNVYLGQSFLKGKVVDAAAILNALGYDPVNSLIKDPVEFAEYVRKMADLAVDILDTIDNKL